jgi:hypothetical protein
MDPHTLTAAGTPAKMIVNRDARMYRNTPHNTPHSTPYEIYTVNYEFSQRKFMTALARAELCGLCGLCGTYKTDHDGQRNDHSYKQRAVDNFDARTHEIKVYAQYKGDVKIE